MSKFLTLRLNRFVPSGLLALVAAMLLAPAAANATPYVVKVTQQGSNVVMTAGGAFDLTGLTSLGLYSTTAPVINPVYATLYLGSQNGLTTVDAYTGFTGPTAFGSGGSAYATNSTGDDVYIDAPDAFFAVPTGYQSGNLLSNTNIWDNATFASLGMTPGTYVWTWGSGAEQSFTLNVAVPEPAVLGMFGLGVLLIGGFATLRRRTA